MSLVLDPTKRDELSAALEEVAKNVRLCTLCGCITSAQHNPCALCTNPKRDAGLLCVVEEPADILSIESSGGFSGRYHALYGRLSAAKGTGPTELRLRELAERVHSEHVREVVLALGTDVEGDSTASYINEMFLGTGVAVTRLAFGLPVDSGIRYADSVTLQRAFRGRQSL